MPTDQLDQQRVQRFLDLHRTRLSSEDPLLLAVSYHAYRQAERENTDSSRTVEQIWTGHVTPAVQVFRENARNTIVEVFAHRAAFSEAELDRLESNLYEALEVHVRHLALPSEATIEQVVRSNPEWVDEIYLARALEALNQLPAPYDADGAVQLMRIWGAAPGVGEKSFWLKLALNLDSELLAAILEANVRQPVNLPGAEAAHVVAQRAEAGQLVKPSEFAVLHSFWKVALIRSDQQRYWNFLLQQMAESAESAERAQHQGCSEVETSDQAASVIREMLGAHHVERELTVDEMPYSWMVRLTPTADDLPGTPPIYLVSRESGRASLFTQGVFSP